MDRIAKRFMKIAEEVATAVRAEAERNFVAAFKMALAEADDGIGYVLDGMSRFMRAAKRSSAYGFDIGQAGGVFAKASTDLNGFRRIAGEFSGSTVSECAGLFDDGEIEGYFNWGRKIDEAAQSAVESLGRLSNSKPKDIGVRKAYVALRDRRNGLQSAVSSFCAALQHLHSSLSPVRVGLI